MYKPRIFQRFLALPFLPVGSYRKDSAIRGLLDLPPSPNMAPTHSLLPTAGRPLPSAKMEARAAPSPVGSAGPETRWGPERRPSPTRQQG